MNRFVVVVHESYDCFTAAVPHPVLTRHTAEELLAAMQGVVNESMEWHAEYCRKRAAGEQLLLWDPPRGSGPLLDTGMSFSFFELQYVTDATPETPLTAEVLTVDEWFERYGNIRFNGLEESKQEDEQ